MPSWIPQDETMRACPWLACHQRADAVPVYAGPPPEQATPLANQAVVSTAPAGASGKLCRFSTRRRRGQLAQPVGPVVFVGQCGLVLGR